MMLSDFVRLVESRTGKQSRPNGSGFLCLCPAHDDHNPSLSISTGDNGAVLVKCFAGCSVEDVCRAVGVKVAALFPERPNRRNPPWKIVSTYDYCDELGNLLFQVCRLDPKDFRQRKPDGAGGWTWKTKGVRKVLFRLPEIRDAVKSGRQIYIAEGEKDALALVANGLDGTTNPGGASNWRLVDDDALTGADCAIIADKDTPGRKHAQDVAKRLQRRKATVRVIELPDIGERKVKDAHDFFAAGGTVEALTALADAAPIWKPSAPAPLPSDDDLAAMMADDRDTPTPLAQLGDKPGIQLPGDRRLISDFAAEIGDLLRAQNIYLRGGIPVRLNEKTHAFEPVEAEFLRTWAEKFLTCYQVRRTPDEVTFKVCRTMTAGDAQAVLSAPQFMERLREVDILAAVPVPVIRPDGRIELTRPGYDAQAKVLTESALELPVMPLTVAKSALDSILEEFCWADDGRSKAVTISAMLSIWAGSILPPGALRPFFIILGNAEGCGKGLLAKLAVMPTLGTFPATSAPAEEAEWKKYLLSIIMEGKRVAVLDNFRGHLKSAALEGFLTAQNWSDRILGVSKTFTGQNNCTMLLTGNQCTIGPDVRRRALIVELFMTAERAEDRIFKRKLEARQILEMRADILGALWAIIRAWDAAGRPAPKRSHASFPDWADIFGGMVEFAGWHCPLDTAKLEGNGGDVDLEDMRRLATAATDTASKDTFDMAQLCALAAAQGCFERFMVDGAINAQKLGYMIRNYDRRMVGPCRFTIFGKGHQKRFIFERITP